MGGGPAPGFGHTGGAVDDSAPSASSDASAGAAAAFWAAAAAVDRSETAALADLEAEREATTLAHVSLDLGDDGEDGEDDDPSDDGEAAAIADGDAEGMASLEQTETGGSPELEVEPALPGEAEAPAAVALEADDAWGMAADADIEGDDSTAVAADADRDAAPQVSATTADPVIGARFDAEEAAGPATIDAPDAVVDIAGPTELDAAREAAALDAPHTAAMIEDAQGSSRYRAGIGESATDARTGSVLHPAASYESPIQDGLVDVPRETTQIDPTLE